MYETIIGVGLCVFFILTIFIVGRATGRKKVLDNGERTTGVDEQSNNARNAIDRTEALNRDIESTVKRISDTDKSSEDILARNRDILSKIKARGDDK